MNVSEKFVATLKLHELPAYRIAQKADVDPVKLSKLINGIVPAKPQDPHVIAVGRVLGLSAEECFEPTTVPFGTKKGDCHP